PNDVTEEEDSDVDVQSARRHPGHSEDCEDAGRCYREPGHRITCESPPDFGFLRPVRISSSGCVALIMKLTDNERNVLPSETKTVAEYVLDFFFAGRIGHIVQIALRIGVFIIDCWRKHAFTQGHDRNDELNGAGRGDQVSDHALAAAHG